MELIHKIGVRGTVQNAEGQPIAAILTIVCKTKTKTKMKTNEKWKCKNNFLTGRKPEDY